MKFVLSVLLILSTPAIANNTLGLPAIDIPVDNPQTKQKIALGREIFNDRRFSRDGSISCASCHLKNKAFTDGRPVAKGIKGLTGTRNAPTVVNAAFLNTLFVDGREKSLEDQALQPLLNPIEHGLKDKQEILTIVLKNKHYTQQLQQIFKVSEQHITVEHVAKAIASFERTLISANSAFDRYYFARDRSQLSESAARGLLLFRRKGNCANCHEISWNNALFTDNRFYNIGAGFKSLQPILSEFIQALTEQGGSVDFPLTREQQSELGRFNVTQVITDIGKFKTPTLRNIALTAPYMHNGSLQTLEQVVEYYNKGGDDNRFIDPAIFPLQLSHQEKIDLVNFMKSLTSSEYIEKGTDLQVK